jgi:putative PIN family toxin of toxin-antitoxin system
MKPIKVFLDSSVIIAGLASKRGGSYELLALAEVGIITPYISEQVINEVLRNTQKKLPGCVDLFYLLFERLPFIIADPAIEHLLHAKAFINENDAPIIAAALTAKADWLVSLDSHFLSKDWKGEVGLLIGTPGDFLQKMRIKDTPY